MDFLTGTGVDRASPNCTRSIAIARRGPLAGLVPAESYAEGRSRHRGLDHHLTVRSASPPSPVAEVLRASEVGRPQGANLRVRRECRLRSGRSETPPPWGGMSHAVPGSHTRAARRARDRFADTDS
jgi:hypothetical protein